MKQDPQLFKDGDWSFERKYSVRSVVADRYVSIVRDDYMDTHGAHPNTDVNTILWDKVESKPHQHPPVLQRDRRQRSDHDRDAEGDHCLAQGREEEA